MKKKYRDIIKKGRITEAKHLDKEVISEQMELKRFLIPSQLHFSAVARCVGAAPLLEHSRQAVQLV